MCKTKKFLGTIWQHGIIKYVLLLIIVILLALDLCDRSIFPIGSCTLQDLANFGQFLAGLLSLLTLIMVFIAYKELKRNSDNDRQAKIKHLGDIYCWFEYKKDAATNQNIGINMIIKNQMDIPVSEWKVTINGQELFNNEKNSLLIPNERCEFQTTLEKATKISDIQFVFEFKSQEGKYLTRDSSGHLSEKTE